MTTNSKAKTAAKVGVSVGAVGLAVTAMTGAFGAWTDTETAAQTVTAGVVDFAAGTENTLTTEFGPFAPGDSGSRNITLVNGNNSNTLDMGNITLGASVGTVSGGGATASTTLPADVTVTLQSCTTAERTSCTNVASATGNLTNWETPKTMAASLAKNNTQYYKLNYAVAAEPNDDTEGASATVTWTISGTPRAAITSR